MGLPGDTTAELNAAGFVDAMTGDKKGPAGKIRDIVLTELGKACVTEDVSLEDIASVIDA